MVLETIANRLDEQYYKIEYCTFEYIFRRIFEYKNKGELMSERELLQKIYSTKKPVKGVHRSSYIDENGDSDDDVGTNDKGDLDTYLTEGSKRQFNNFVRETVKIVEKYSSL